MESTDDRLLPRGFMLPAIRRWVRAAPNPQRRAAEPRITTCPISTVIRVVNAVTLALTVATWFAACSESEDQARQAALEAQHAEVKAEQAEDAAMRARTSAQQAQIAVDRAQKAVEDATREIDRVAEHLERMNQTEGTTD